MGRDFSDVVNFVTWCARVIDWVDGREFSVASCVL